MKRPYQDNVYLTGFMGSGKSTVGPLVAQALGRPFVDTDTLVEKLAGLAVRAIFEKKGEAAFRSLETKALEQLAGQAKIVVALGGGALVAAANAETVLDTGHLVYLRTGVETIAERVRGDDRPLLKGLKGPELARRIQTLLAEREAVYKLARIQVDTDGKRPDEVAALVVRKVKECAGSR
jgi:shikimate kinase